MSKLCLYTSKLWYGYTCIGRDLNLEPEVCDYEKYTAYEKNVPPYINPAIRLIDKATMNVLNPNASRQ